MNSDGVAIDPQIERHLKDRVWSELSSHCTISLDFNFYVKVACLGVYLAFLVFLGKGARTSIASLLVAPPMITTPLTS